MKSQESNVKKQHESHEMNFDNFLITSVTILDLTWNVNSCDEFLLNVEIHVFLINFRQGNVKLVLLRV